MLAVCSVMGLPWFVAATVLSISHVNSLKVASESTAPGEQPHFLGIREQRVTGFIIFTLMGCSVFLTSVLKVSVLSTALPTVYILTTVSMSPLLSLSVTAAHSDARPLWRLPLYGRVFTGWHPGVFLMSSPPPQSISPTTPECFRLQLFDRIKLLAMPSKHQPDLIYLRYVPLWKVHVFTAVQLLCLVALWSIKASAAAVVFPMMVRFARSCSSVMVIIRLIFCSV